MQESQILAGASFQTKWAGKVVSPYRKLYVIISYPAESQRGVVGGVEDINL